VRYFEGLKNGDYEIKFIVDGSYQLNSQYGIVESSEEHGLINILEVRISHSTDDKDALALSDLISGTTLTTFNEVY